MFHISSENPFNASHTYHSGATNDRVESITRALAIVRKVVGGARGPSRRYSWLEVTPDGTERVDGRTVAALLARGCVVACLRRGSGEQPSVFVWSEEAIKHP